LETSEHPGGNSRTWQQTKSEQTRTAVLDAALECFFILVFNRTTTEKIAKQANVSRGAMLHHFPQRSDLIQASVWHLHRKRLEAFEDTLSKVNEDAEFTLVEEGIDAFWEQLQSPLFSIYCELLVAARTDSELRATMEPAIRDFQKAWRAKSERIFPDLALSKQYGVATAVTRFFLEGIAFNAQAIESSPIGDSAQEMVNWLKTMVRNMFNDIPQHQTPDKRLATVIRDESNRSDEHPG